ncbi:unnamed protein product [Prunus armeniaca]
MSYQGGDQIICLRGRVSEDFGFDNVDSGGMAIQGTTRKSYVSKNGAGFEKKVWTKARQTNVGNRVVLSDISKQPGKPRASGLFGGKTNLGFSGFSKSSVSNKGMKVVDESRAFVFDFVNAYMDSLGKGQSLYQEKAVYIFGHQPPNIANNSDHHGKDCDPKDDEDYVASSLHDGLLFDEGMDISTGKVNDSNGNVVRNAFNDVESAPCTKFRYTMMELIHAHRVHILFFCELRIVGAKALDVVKSLGFLCFEVVDPVGFFGGLWLLWNDSKVRVEAIGTINQTISASIAWPGQNPWLFTAIYAKLVVLRDKSYGTT